MCQTLIYGQFILLVTPSTNLAFTQLDIGIIIIKNIMYFIHLKKLCVIF